jgi:hypothetical protein
MNEQTTDRQFSITKPNEWEKTTPSISYILPLALWDNQRLLPSVTPEYYWSGYYRARDVVLLSTPKIEPEGWGVALSKAAAKFASRSWEIKSAVPLRARRLQGLLNHAGAGLGQFGWYEFASVAFYSFSLVGAVYIEIERDRQGRIVNIHYLNPLRCQLRNDSRFPVRYLRTDGTEVDLPADSVQVIHDTLDPTLGEYGQFDSAAARAYTSIVRQNSVNWYTIEKVKGERPLSLSFVQGLSSPALNDALITARQDNERQGEKSYMGAVVIPIMNDIPLTVVEIPLAALPDKFNIEEERKRSDLVNANALGLDPQDINPALLASGSIGTGTQALVLAEAAKGNTSAVFAKMLARFINDLDPLVEFSFQETDYNDEDKKEGIRQKRAATAKTYIDAGILTAEQALNMLVDEGDIPEVFLRTDETHEEIVEDEENPEAEQKIEDKPEDDTAVNEAEGGKAQKALPFRRIRLKQTGTIADDAIELPEAEIFRKAMERIVRRQFEQFPAKKALRQIGADNFETVELAQVEAVVRDNLPPIDPDGREEEALLLALLAAALLALRRTGQGLTPLQLAEAEGQIRLQLSARLAALFGATIPSEAPSPPYIGNPNLPLSPLGIGLNGGSVTLISLLLLSAIREIVAGGGAVTYTAVEAEYKRIAKERADTRSETITVTEMARAAGLGAFIVAGILIAMGKTVTKTWLRTRSKTPRMIHLAQVGVTVPYNGPFPDGSFWSNELPNCKCGIEVKVK